MHLVTPLSCVSLFPLAKSTPELTLLMISLKRGKPVIRKIISWDGRGAYYGLKLPGHGINILLTHITYMHDPNIAVRAEVPEINWLLNTSVWNMHKIFYYSDVIMRAMASQINGVAIVYLTVCSGAYQRKHRSSVSLAFVRGIHRWPMNSSHKKPVTRKIFPFDDVIMFQQRGVSYTR